MMVEGSEAPEWLGGVIDADLDMRAGCTLAISHRKWADTRHVWKK